MTSYWLDTHPITERGVPFEPDQRYDTVVVGAGLTGVTTALLLAQLGQRVALLEARSVGAVTTGNTTAKVSLLQGTVLSEMRAHHHDEVLAAYVEANRAAQAWLLDALNARGVPHQVRTAWTYSQLPEGRRVIDAELDAASAAGLPVAAAQDPGLPFLVTAAIRLDDQAQIHPTEALDALLSEFLTLGGVLHSDCRVRNVDTGQPCRVITEAGSITAQLVVLATGTPILDRGGHFARLQAERSYALAARVPGPLPLGMYLSVDDPLRSLRTAPDPDADVLLVGGNNHVVGRHASPRSLVADLLEWCRQHFPGAEQTHVWSAQDYRPAGGVPMVGPLTLGGGHIFVATGYNKWGMTNAVAAALRLASKVSGDTPPEWATVLDGAHAAGVADAVQFGARVAGSATSGWLVGEAHALPAEPPAEGAGVVGRLGVRPAARSTVDGRTCTVSAVCTHMGGVLTWNDEEHSWDCPLHGSRFDASGHVLEGPAVRDLKVLG